MTSRGKSWVSRRLGLAEALSEELQADLRLGLVSATVARELCRLPRDNQQEVATTVGRRGLTTRQTQTLVDAWLAAPTESARVSLLTTIRGTDEPAEAREPRRPRTSGEWMVHDAEELRRRCGRLHGRLVARPPADDEAEVPTGLSALRPALRGQTGGERQDLAEETCVVMRKYTRRSAVPRHHRPAGLRGPARQGLRRRSMAPRPCRRGGPAPERTQRAGDRVVGGCGRNTVRRGRIRMPRSPLPWGRAPTTAKEAANAEVASPIAASASARPRQPQARRRRAGSDRISRCGAPRST